MTTASQFQFDPRAVRTIYCIGRNFTEHARELNHPVPSEPVVFLKPASSLCFSGSAIELPSCSNRIDHEVEIVVVMGARVKNISADHAQSQLMTVVAGYAIGLDVTARDLQEKAKSKSLPWAVSKGFDTFAGLGGFVSAAQAGDFSALRFQLDVNGALRQKGKASEMLFGIPALISYLSSVFTLFPGDLIFTGTPAGVAPLAAGDRLNAVLEGQGGVLSRLELGVRARAE